MENLVAMSRRNFARQILIKTLLRPEAERV